MGPVAGRPELRALGLADRPERWAALGFAVDGDTIALGGVSLAFGLPGRGIVGWLVAGVEDASVDGLPALAAPPAAGAAVHLNGAIGIDHVVIATPDFKRTAGALERAGMPLRRTREAPGGVLQGFRRLGPAILELVQTPGGDENPAHPDGPARFWGLVVVVADLEALAGRLGEHLGPIKPAVQPGRRIATLRTSAGLGQPVAFMDPES